MNILVTGGAGFIGSHIVDAYIQAGHHVAVMDNLVTGSEHNLNPLAEFHRVDITDRAAVDRVFASGRFDLVNHHAAQLDVRASVRDPQYDAMQNIIGSLNVFEAALHTGVHNVIFASSGGVVYGEQESFPADEDHPTNPISPYGVAKLAVEKYLRFYHGVHGMHYVVFRYTNVYGPRQNPRGEAGVIAIFCDRMFNGQQPVINGSGAQTRDYVYVADVVRAHVMALDYLNSGHCGVFNIGTETETSVNQLFRMLNSMLDNRFTEEHGPALPGEQVRSVCSYEHAAFELGWQPQVSLLDGLKRTLAFYREQA